MKKLVIIGSTGSIGTQTLDVVRHNREQFEVVMLIASSNVASMISQCREFCPKYVALTSEKCQYELSQAINAPTIVIPPKEIEKILETIDYDVLVAAASGIYSLKSVISAIKRDKVVALANKETLVAGGKFVKEALASHKNAAILPVDSEHSAIWQSIGSNNHSDIHKIILTASGGAFRDYTMEELSSAKAADALKHPNWYMGAKITIDCATLMNKGLELIEAVYLFDVKESDIDIVVHRESIIHSMVEYVDGAIIAELSNPSMIIPIQYALTYPNRIKSGVANLDFKKLQRLTFEELNLELFPSIALCREVAREGGILPIVMNAANTAAVQLFMEGKIGFQDIHKIISNEVNNTVNHSDYSLEDVFALNDNIISRLLIT